MQWDVNHPVLHAVPPYIMRPRQEGRVCVCVCTSFVHEIRGSQPTLPACCIRFPCEQLFTLLRSVFAGGSDRVFGIEAAPFTLVMHWGDVLVVPSTEFVTS